MILPYLNQISPNYGPIYPPSGASSNDRLRGITRHPTLGGGAKGHGRGKPDCFLCRGQFNKEQRKTIEPLFLNNSQARLKTGKYVPRTEDLPGEIFG